MISDGIPSRAGIRFLNVDLDIHSSHGFQDILIAFGSAVIVMNSSSEFLSLELSEGPSSVEGAIVRFGELVEQLPHAARAQWDKCRSKTMNVGIQSGTSPYAVEFRLPCHVFEVLLGVGADVVWTVYAIESEEVDPANPSEGVNF